MRRHLLGQRLHDGAHLQRAAKRRQMEPLRHRIAAHKSHHRRRRGVRPQLVPGRLLHLPAIRQLRIYGLGRTVTQDSQGHLASGRHLSKHLLQLLGALDRLGIELHHNVAHAQPGLAGRSVVIDHRDQRAPRIFQMQRLRLAGVHIGHFDPQVPRRRCRRLSA